MAKTVNFTVKLNIDGKEHLVTVGRDARKFAGQLGFAKVKAEELRASVINFNQVSLAIRNISASLQSVIGVMGEYTQAYSRQAEAETKLETIMRQRMAASADDIQGIKDLTAAQQQLGVIGDEVQLMGAQQIATFATHKSTLETLIPAMNDLLAQQKGVNATSQDAVSIGNLLGKALQGNVSALTRVGITLTDTQKKMMQQGDETQRAATLAEIITSNVGHMNAELAKTDVGKAQQMANTIGDIKEQVGALYARFQPAIGAAAQVTMAFNGLVTTTTSILALVKAITAWSNSTKLAAFNTKAASAIVSRFTTIMGVSTMSITAGTRAVQALTWAIRGLEVATGIGIVVAALSLVVGNLGGASSKVADETEGLSDSLSDMKDEARMASSTYESTLKSTYSDMMSKYEGLKEGWKALRTEQSKIEWIKANQQEFEYLHLRINNVSDAENLLVKNTDVVVESFKRRAEAAAYAAKLTQLYEQQLSLQDKKKKASESIKSDAAKSGRSAQAGDIIPEDWRSSRYGSVDNAGVWRFSEQGAALYSGVDTTTNPIIQGLERDLTEVNAQIDDTAAHLAELKKGDTWIKAAPSPVGGSRSGRSTGSGKTEEVYGKGELGWIEQEISKLNKQKLHLSDPQDVRELNEQIALLERAKKYIETMAQFSASDMQIFAALDKKGTSAVGGLGDMSSLLPEVKPIEIPITADLAQVRKELQVIAEEMGLRMQAEEADKATKTFNAATDAVSQMGSSLSELGKSIGVPALDIMGVLAQAIVTMIRGFAEASAMAAEIGGPWGWIGFSALGLAQLATMVSTVKGMGAFAEGGIVSGPTLGLVGEYAGASHNPEVIAPLDKLRGMIQAPQVSLPPGSIVGKLRGNDILLVAANASQTRALSGRRTNIAG